MSTVAIGTAKPVDSSINHMDSRAPPPTRPDSDTITSGQSSLLDLLSDDTFPKIPTFKPPDKAVILSSFKSISVGARTVLQFPTETDDARLLADTLHGDPSHTRPHILEY